jgi:DNA primase
LGRYTREAVVCYDPDSAGIAATQRSLDLFLEEDFRVKILRLPEGRDPDAFIRSEGVEEYRNRLKQVVSYLDFVLETAMRSQGNLDTPRSKVQVLNQVLPYLARLPNAVERSDYVFQFARRLNLENGVLLAEVRKAAQQRSRRLPEERVAVVTAMKFAEKRLLQVLLANPSLQTEVLPFCSSQDFHGLATERIFAAIQERAAKGTITTFGDLHGQFAGEAEQGLLAQMQMEEVPEGHSRDTAESFLNALRKSHLESDKQEIQSKIAEASQRRDDEMLGRLMQQRIQVDRELMRLSQK